jgi:hypothetical protein
MPEIPGRLITYCSNIHPAESWEETFAALRRHVPAVKAAVSLGHPFPIGLRFSSRATGELSAGQNRAFTAWLEEQDCFIPTINGFPFGPFHGAPVKQRAYLPDWRSPERAEYTIRLARLLAGWLPDGLTGSISTVPLAYRGCAGTGDYPEILGRLESVLTRLGAIFEETGKTIVLALEPEPGCLLETTDEVCRFFDSLKFPARLLRHLGLCYDCCHQAVQFEDAADSLNRLTLAGIPLAKVQVSSALRASGADAARLADLDEPCYLHQVVVRREGGELLRYADLPEALSRHDARPGDEWRCHFHVPIFLAQTEHTGTTQDFLRQLLPRVPKELLLEVETYTWEVLPAELRAGTVTDSIIREIQWLKELAW